MAARMKRHAEERRRWRVLAEALPARVVGAMAGSAWQRALVTAATLVAPTDPPAYKEASPGVTSCVAVHVGRRLVAYGGGGEIEIRTGKKSPGVVELFDLASRRHWGHEHHADRVQSLAFSPDGDWLASGGDDQMVLALVQLGKND
jgi:hypothetical protein